MVLFIWGQEIWQFCLRKGTLSWYSIQMQILIKNIYRMTQVFLAVSACQGFRISWSEGAKPHKPWSHLRVRSPCFSPAPRPCRYRPLFRLLWQFSDLSLPVLSLLQSRLHAVLTVPFRDADPAITRHCARPGHLQLLRPLVLGSKTSCLSCRPLSSQPFCGLVSGSLHLVCILWGHLHLPSSALLSPLDLSHVSLGSFPSLTPELALRALDASFGSAPPYSDILPTNLWACGSRDWPSSCSHWSQCLVSHGRSVGTGGEGAINQWASRHGGLAAPSAADT